MPDSDRIAALHEAVVFHCRAGTFAERCGEDRAVSIARGERAVRETGEVFLAWLRGPASLRLLAGTIVDQSTGLPTGTPISTGGSVQIHDDEKFDYTLEELDAKGFPTDGGVPVDWTSSDETVVPLSADGSTFHVVAGNPGTSMIQASVTLTDGRVVTVSEAVDVVPAGVETVALVAGPVTAQ